MKLKTLRTIDRLMNSASKDETRPFINGVNCSIEGETVILQATDGSILTKYIVEDNDLLDTIDTHCKNHQCTISREYSKILKEYLKINKKLPDNTEVELDINNQYIMLEDRISLRLIDREFPKTSSIIPTGKDTNCRFSINADLLTRLVKSLEFTKSRFQGKQIIFEVIDASKPIVIKNIEDTETCLSIIMPIRMD